MAGNVPRHLSNLKMQISRLTWGRSGGCIRGRRGSWEASSAGWSVVAVVHRDTRQRAALTDCSKVRQLNSPGPCRTGPQSTRPRSKDSRVSCPGNQTAMASTKISHTVQQLRSVQARQNHNTDLFPPPLPPLLLLPPRLKTLAKQFTDSGHTPSQRGHVASSFLTCARIFATESSSGTRQRTELGFHELRHTCSMSLLKPSSCLRLHAS